MMLVPGMAIGAITNYQAMSMPERFPEEWANSGLKCSPTLYRILMVISIITSLMTSFFSLTSLTLPLAIGTVIATILIFVWTWYRMKKGYVNITSTLICPKNLRRQNRFPLQCEKSSRTGEDFLLYRNDCAGPGTVLQ